MHKSIFKTLISNSSIPSPELSPDRLTQEGTMLVMAGTESTAKTLGIAFFHLLSSPQLLHHLRASLRSQTSWPASVNVVDLENVEYLMAVLSEATRLGFGLSGRNARVLPDAELRYRGYVVPRGTPVSMTTLCIHRHVDLFPRPDEFLPERWMGREGRERQQWNYGFGRGSRRCLGMALGHAEMVLAMAECVRWDCEF